MTHPLYAVGLRDQAPLLLVLADAGVVDVMARVKYWEVVADVGATPATATRPIWSRATTAGAGYSTVTPGPLNPYVQASQFEGRYNYGVPPDHGEGTTAFPFSRDGYAQRVQFPDQCGPIFGDFCNMSLQADATGTLTWSANVIFEEL